MNLKWPFWVVLVGVGLLVAIALSVLISVGGIALTWDPEEGGNLVEISSLDSILNRPRFEPPKFSETPKNIGFRPEKHRQPSAPVSSGIDVKSVAEMGTDIEDEEMVLGLAIDGQARAYPINMLSDPNREILNDELAGRAVAVTWCDLCQSGLVYDRVLDGKTLTLFVTGSLWNGNMVMQDVETQSMFGQVTGHADGGPLQGSILTKLPATATDWKSWRESYPSTTILALSRVTNQYKHHERYAEYSGEKKFFDRMVVGITDQAGESTRAWTFPLLRRVRIVNNVSPDQKPIVVMFDSRLSSATIFSRTVAGQELSFRIEEDQVRDLETGSTWNPLTGDAVGGALQGQALELLPSTVTFSSSWSKLFPKGQIISELPEVSGGHPG